MYDPGCHRLSMGVLIQVRWHTVTVDIVSLLGTVWLHQVIWHLLLLLLLLSASAWVRKVTRMEFVNSTLFEFRRVCRLGSIVWNFVSGGVRMWFAGMAVGRWLQNTLASGMAINHAMIHVVVVTLVL